MLDGLLQTRPGNCYARLGRGDAGRMQCLNPFSSWLFNVLLWGAIFALAGLSYHVFVAEIISGPMALIALAVIVVLSLFWPKY